MCRGRPQHHIEEEKRRYAGQQAAAAHQAELDRRAQEDRMRQMQEDANRRQQEMLAQIEQSMKQPYKTRTAEDAGVPILGMRNKTAAKKTSVRDLRIARAPSLNVGGNDNGTNLG